MINKIRLSNLHFYSILELYKESQNLSNLFINKIIKALIAQSQLATELTLILHISIIRE